MTSSDGGSLPQLRDSILAGENIDMKQYEAGMRQLLDSYIHAKPVEQRPGPPARVCRHPAVRSHPEAAAGPPTHLHPPLVGRRELRVDITCRPGRTGPGRR